MLPSLFDDFNKDKHICQCSTILLDKKETFTGNLTALQGALLNLVHNASQVTPKGYAISLKADVNDGHITLSVDDHGPGVPNSIKDKIFEPFFTTKTHGTGLGLAVAQVVARGHQGEFHIQSALGRGTTASLILPSLKAGLSAPQAEQVSGNDAETASDKENNL